MPTYNYRAKDDSGKNVRGAIDAADPADVGNLLTRRQLYLIDCRPASPPVSSTRAVKPAELIEFSLQLNLLLQAGMSITQSLDVIEEESAGLLKSTVHDVRARLMGGSSFTDALAAHPRVFPEIYINIMRGGELSGTFDVALAEGAKFLEAREALKKTLQDATIYPLTLLGGSIGVIILLTTVVFPPILGMVKSMSTELPLPARIIMVLSWFLRTFGPGFLALSAIGAVAYNIIMRGHRGRMFLDRAKLRLPFSGQLLIRLELSRLARAAAPMISAGIGLLKVIEIGATTLQNEALRDALRRARGRVEGGRLLSEALAEMEIFPRLFLTLLRVGESTGALDTTFARTAVIYDREVQARIKRAVAILQPSVLAFLGAVVVTTALALFMTVQTVMRQATVGH
jgi:type IV pilus assembly protein PilC